ncbi:uncharacterized protein LOC143220502 [Lasioglossum baleicum]|uniref:uncharacterized protein LOC143220502 n=1 Tax=Lasioglossum baleicum TaxID=434251 RepID=UPI003FCD7CD0
MKSRATITAWISGAKEYYCGEEDAIHENDNVAIAIASPNIDAAERNDSPADEVSTQRRDFHPPRRASLSKPRNRMVIAQTMPRMRIPGGAELESARGEASRRAR